MLPDEQRAAYPGQICEMCILTYGPAAAAVPHVGCAAAAVVVMYDPKYALNSSDEGSNLAAPGLTDVVI